jgi:glycosyltransferase involved in cell wall biosynthesis
MRIAIIVQNFPPHMVGGTERQAEEMARRLSSSHDVVVYTKHYKGLKLVDKRGNYLIKRVKFLNTPFHALSYLSFSNACKNAILEDKKPDIVLAMMLVPSGFIGCMVKKKIDVKVISWIRGGDWYFVKKYLLGRKAIKFVMENSDLILAQTESIKQEVLKEYKPKIEVLGNGVEISDKTASGKYVLFVGNLNRRKGTEYLIYAMKNLKYECLIIGEGKERKNLEQLSSPNVKFLGKKDPDEIKKYMEKAAILVLPAIAGEGLPNVLLEAMNYGVPVIATDIAGIPDLVKHGENGFIVRPKDPDIIKFYIEKIMLDPKLRKEIISSAKQTVKAYGWINIIRQLEKIFKNLD